jgi:hypothetical protein
MGRSLNTPRDGLSIPALAALLPLTHTRLSQTTPIARSPLSRSHGRTECYIRWYDALKWLEAQPDRYTDARRTVRVEMILWYVRNGEPLPRPAQAAYVSAYRRPRSPSERAQLADLPSPTLGR